MDTASALTATCPCGITIRYGEKHFGRTVKCRGCGGAVTLPGPSAHESAPAKDGYAVAEPEPVLPGQGRSIPPPLHEHHAPPESRLLGREDQIAARRRRGFWGDAGRSFLFWMTPSGALALGVLTVMLLARDALGVIPLVGLFAWVLITGTVWGFYLEVIQWTAGGEDDLPEPSAWEGVWESVALPLLKLFCVTTAMLIPAWVIGFSGGSPLAVMAGLLGGLFLWPVMMLAASLGGAMTAMRIDLLARTVASAFAPYLSVWLMLVAAFAAVGLSAAAGMGAAPEFLDPLLGRPLIAAVVINFASVYSTIIAMKLIGLYYRHYSDRFPWDAG